MARGVCDNCGSGMSGAVSSLREVDLVPRVAVIGASPYWCRFCDAMRAVNPSLPVTKADIAIVANALLEALR